MTYKIEIAHEEDASFVIWYYTIPYFPSFLLSCNFIDVSISMIPMIGNRWLVPWVSYKLVRKPGSRLRTNSSVPSYQVKSIHRTTSYQRPAPWGIPLVPVSWNLDQDKYRGLDFKMGQASEESGSGILLLGSTGVWMAGWGRFYSVFNNTPLLLFKWPSIARQILFSFGRLLTFKRSSRSPRSDGSLRNT